MVGVFPPVSAVSARFSTPGGTAPLPGPRANTPVPAEAAEESHRRVRLSRTRLSGRALMDTLGWVGTPPFPGGWEGMAEPVSALTGP